MLLVSCSEAWVGEEWEAMNRMAMMDIRGWVWCVSVCAGFFFCGGARVLAQEARHDGNVVWQIGEFDQTSREFGHDFDVDSASLKPVFTVGKSKTAEWPASQTTSVNGSAGKQLVPYTILFKMGKLEAGNYRLTVAALLVNPAVPDLLVSVNGHTGRYLFNRKISYYAGDDRVDSPIYGGDTLQIDFPGKFLKAGENSVVLTAVEDAENPETRASLIYDALRLTHEPDTKLEPSAAVKPTVFFRQKDGRTVEIVYVTITSADKLHGKVELAIGKEHLQEDVNGGNDFG